MIDKNPPPEWLVCVGTSNKFKYLIVTHVHYRTRTYFIYLFLNWCPPIGGSDSGEGGREK